jgi:hypothetical protein
MNEADKKQLTKVQAYIYLQYRLAKENYDSAKGYVRISLAKKVKKWKTRHANYKNCLYGISSSQTTN